MALAFFWNAMPWSAAAQLLRPDLLLLALLFWALHEPHRVGLGTAFALGLLMDVAGATELGEHALSYVAATFTAQALRVRVLKFRLMLQAVHLAGFVLLERLVALIVNLVMGHAVSGVMVAAQTVGALLCWPLMAWALFRWLAHGRRQRNFG
jgi:rod shape-determining protein MreD